MVICEFFKSLDVEKSIFYVFCAAFFCMPIGTAFFTAFGVLSVILCFFSGLGFKKIPVFIKQSWFWPVLGMILVHWLGFLYSPDPLGFGIQYAQKTHYWLYCIAIASIKIDDKRFVLLLKCFISALFFNSILALFQFTGVISGENGECTGFGVGYRTLSAYLIIGMLIISYKLKSCSSNKTKYFLYFLLVIFFLNLIILKGRTGYITFLAVSPFILHNIFKKINVPKIFLIYLLITGAMFMSPIFRERISLSLEQIKFHINADPDIAWGKGYTVNQDRFYMWHGAVLIFIENPLIGAGTGGYPIAMKKIGKPEWPTLRHPHNDFLYMASSFGIIGVYLYFWIFGEALKNLWMYKDYLLGNFIFSGIIVILVSGITNAQILDAGMAFLFVILIGLQKMLPKFDYV
ncbi:MAG: O-antigen ligase family protein [Desulfobacterales bacterium]|nr:O-antigen ligase family protein [Desulfobacterales bacterium]